MVTIGKLTERITLQSEVRSADNGGGASVSWSTVATVFAQVTPLSGGERWAAGQQMGTQTYRFTIRARSDLSTAQRLQWRGALQVGNNITNSLFIGDGSATFTNGTAYIGFNAVRTASNTWTFTGDGSRNGGVAIDGRMDGALRVHVRASLSGSTVTETDSNMATNERMQIQRTLISMGGPLGSESFRVATTSNMVNRVEVVGSATGSPIVLRAAGTDSNIDVQLTPKGTGVLNLSLDSGNLASTVGSAGAASALPANPTGFLRVRLNGTIRKIPYYND